MVAQSREEDQTLGHTALLSPRELTVLRLTADGLRDGAIAERLQISKKTVAFHRGNLYTKIGASNRVELTRFAIDQGLAPVAWRRRST
jgi:DNA-binding NarL/FixJ family response regulator